MLGSGRVDDLNGLKHAIMLIELFEVAIKIIGDGPGIDIMPSGLRPVNNPKLGKRGILKTQEDKMDGISGLPKPTGNVPGGFVGKVAFIGKILVRGKCGLYKMFKCFGDKSVCELCAFFVRFYCPPKVFSFFDEELIPIKNGSAIPDALRQIVGSNAGFTRPIGAGNNKKFGHTTYRD